MKKQQRRHSEEMRLYWLFCPAFKDHQSNIVEDCDFTISLRFQRVGSKGNLMLAYHWLCDFSFLNQKNPTKAIERTVMKSRETMRVLDSVPSDINDRWCWAVRRTGFTQKRNKSGKQNSSSGKLLLSRSRKSGSHTWVGLGFFLSREIMSNDTGIYLVCSIFFLIFSPLQLPNTAVSANQNWTRAFTLCHIMFLFCKWYVLNTKNSIW